MDGRSSTKRCRIWLGPVPTLGILLSGCFGEWDDGAKFGFRASYEVPCKSPGAECCGLDGCGPRESEWIDGLHDDFAKPGPKQLALDSLLWFEKSPEAATWRTSASARLELVYPSDDLRITARYDPGLGLSWEEQLQAWFERFPPGGDGPQEIGKEAYDGVVEFGDHGRVEESAATDTKAVDGMKSILASRPSSSVFPRPSLSLRWSRRRSSHEMDVFGVDAAAPEELDDLPSRLREKRAHVRE